MEVPHKTRLEGHHPSLSLMVSEIQQQHKKAPFPSSQDRLDSTQHPFSISPCEAIEHWEWAWRAQDALAGLYPCVGFRTGQLMHNEVFAHLVFAVRKMGLALVAE